MAPNANLGASIVVKERRKRNKKREKEEKGRERERDAPSDKLRQLPAQIWPILATQK